METVSSEDVENINLGIVFSSGMDWSDGVTDELPQDLLVFLGENERVTTRRLYEYYLRKWADYRVIAGCPNDLYLVNSVSERNRVSIWCKFIVYLITIRGIKENALKQHLSGIRNRLASYMDTTFSCSVKWAIIGKFIRAGRYTTEERVQRDLAKQAREKLPMPDVMLVWLHRVLWLETLWDWNGIYMKGTWLACVIMMIRGVRISSVCVTAAEHELLTTEVYLFIIINNQRVQYICGNGDWPIGALPKNVLSIELRNMTSKTTTEGNSISIERKVDIFSGWCVNVVSEWIYYFWKCMIPCMPFAKMFRFEPRTKILRERHIRPSQINTAIKVAARAFSLPPDHFSSRSFRKRVAFAAGAGEVSWEYTNSLAGWSKGSVTGLNCYSHANVIYKPVVNQRTIQEINLLLRQENENNDDVQNQQIVKKRKVSWSVDNCDDTTIVDYDDCVFEQPQNINEIIRSDTTMSEQIIITPCLIGKEKKLTKKQISNYKKKRLEEDIAHQARFGPVTSEMIGALSRTCSSRDHSILSEVYNLETPLVKGVEINNTIVTTIIEPEMEIDSDNFVVNNTIDNILSMNVEPILDCTNIIIVSADNLGGMVTRRRSARLKGKDN